MQVTRKSMLSGQTNTIEIPCTPEQLGNLVAKRGLVQDIMPDVPPGLREFVLTGITPDEWNEYFRSEEDENV